MARKPIKKPATRPVILLGMSVIFLTFGVFGGWAAVARLDSAVVASGQISLESNRKVVQHFEGGIVEEILVKEADTVEEGQVLLRLSSVEARSNVEMISNRLDVARVVEVRLLAERGMKDILNFPPDLTDPEATYVVRAAVEDQADLFRDRQSIMQSQSNILASRVEQTHEQIHGLELQRSALERRITNYTEMLDRMRDGGERGLIEKNLLSQREDELIQIEATLGQIISEIAQARNVISETELQALQVQQEYRERANNELEEIRAELTELQERAKVAGDVMSRTEIRSPGKGTIQDLKVHTIGSVVRPGDVLMELVPENEQLVINARVSPVDIDSVTPGLATEVRFTAFKTRLTPIMLGKVQSVSNDVITPDNPNETPYYLARIDVEKVEVPEEIEGRLTPGMPADVIITTGERRVVDYIASPLMDAIRKSLIEE
ncbi:HlyD family type I secretion periplasmic adaptor subunit [Pseudooceanicola aestuarii]|uniref:HlyD family type I secretion periplasmic adaptor subunit n=1 Tax=Pseudooceanicola aestuarii TaxID=2697319 RepID=UPI0013D2CBDB|nr:HlyD family type I secretion periplasmic adaptor subunit [Pseudooceanicola aestuarii]